MPGGGPVDEVFTERIGAVGYISGAPGGADLAMKFVGLALAA